MHNISGNESFLAIIEQMAQVVISPCKLIVPTLVLITLMLSLIKGFTAREGVSVDYGPVARGFVLLGLLYFYQELLGLISGTIAAFAGYLNQPTNIYDHLDQMAQIRRENTDQTLTGYVEEVVAFVDSFNLLSLLQSFALGGVASIARKVMELLRQTLLGLLFVTGPIAISLSVLPMFGQLVHKWFQNYLAVQCWSITLIILDNMVVLYRRLSQHELGLMHGMSVSEAVEKLDMILITLVMALLYFMVPYLTSLFIGQTQSAVYPARVVATGAGAAILTARGVSLISRAVSGTRASAASSRTSGNSPEGGATADTPSYASGENPRGRGGAGQAIPVRQ